MHFWSIGVVLGIMPVGLLSDLPGWPWPQLLLGAAGLLYCWPCRSGRFLCGLALGCALALYHGNTLVLKRLPSDCVKQPLTLEGAVSSLPRTSVMPDGARRQRFEFSVAAIHPSRCQGPARLLLSYYGPHKMIPGDRWQFDAALKRPWGLANPGSYNMQAWFAQTGIDAVGSVRSADAHHLTANFPVTTVHHRVRLDISGHISRLQMDPQVLAILRAITVADKSAIDSALWSLLQQFGVNHLLVISGLHIGLVAGAGYLLGGLVSRSFYLAVGGTAAWLPGVLALILACGYAALAGFSLSTQRALCMLACFILAAGSGRSSSPGNNLLLAALVVLVLNPVAALGSGFWLSFGAVAALLWLARWQRGVGACRRLLGTHVFMALVMLPMGAWWFGGSSLVGALANLLMIPLVGFVVVPAALLAVLSYLLDLPLQSGLWRLAAWPLEQLLPLAGAIADRNPNWLYQSFSPFLPDVLLGLLAVALLVVPCGRSIRLLAIVLLVPMVLPLSPGQEANKQATYVTVLDVGQGTAVIIHAQGRTLLYDTGGGDPAGVNMASSVVLPYLRNRGIRQLDTFVVSHRDADHSAGVASVLQAMQVGRLRYGDGIFAQGSGAPCVAGESWHWPGGMEFQLLSPAVETSLSSNDGSCVLQVQIGQYTLLLAGDIERDRERIVVRYWASNLRSDWLLAPHHGSLTSSTVTLLKSVQPALVVMSNGYANRFGHPHPQVLERLQQLDAAVLSTADSGAIEFEFRPGKPLQVRRYRQDRHRFWM
jgi:competence protein ComEC